MGIYSESFKKNLRKALESKQITKAELHRRTGISLSMVYRYLEDAVPSLGTVELIAEALNTTPMELIKTEDAPLLVSRKSNDELLEKHIHVLKDCYINVIREIVRENNMTNNPVV